MRPIITIIVLIFTTRFTVIMAIRDMDIIPMALIVISPEDPTFIIPVAVATEAIPDTTDRMVIIIKTEKSIMENPMTVMIEKGRAIIGNINN